MAIAFDAHTGNQTGTGTVTFTHSATGANIVACIGVQTLSSNADKLGTVTYNGTVATRASDIGGPGAGDEHCYHYVLGGITTGTGTVLVQAVDSRTVAVAISTFTGASSTVPDAKGSQQATTTSLQTQITTVADNAWMVGFGRNQSGDNLGAGANTTVRDTAHSFSMFDANAAKTPAGVGSLQTTNSSGIAYHALASIAPSVAAAGGNTSGLQSKIWG